MSTPGPRLLAALVVCAIIVAPVSPVLAEDATSTDASTSTGSLLDERLADRNADTTAPTIDTHGNVTVEATSEDGAVVAYTLPATTDNVDGLGIASCTPAPGSTFPVGNTTVTCTATDAAGNAATPSTFSVIVTAMVVEEATSTDATSTPAATSTPSSVDTTTGTSTNATSTPQTVDTTTGTSTNATSTDETIDTSNASGDQGSGSASGSGAGSGTGNTSTENPDASSAASTTSAYVPPEESDTDNTDFENIVAGPLSPPCDESEPGCVQDVSATSTEALALDPKFAVANSTEGTGSKFGGAIFTGSATASTTVKNILNITRSSVDGPGKTNSSIIKSEADNEGDVTTTDETRAFTGENRGLGGEGDATIRTGDARSSARVLNVVNTNFFNSIGLVLFLNPDDGASLDLRESDLSYFLNEGVGASPTQLGCTVLTCLNSANLVVLNKNEAMVDNDVYVRAATGDNAATSTKSGNIDIETGNAYASANVLNMVNTNFVNSKYFVASFDKFGTLQGDIVLPDPVFFEKFFKNGNTLPELNSSSFIVENDNEETFAGTTTAHALTGGNTATSSALGHGEITTGQARTSSTSYTAANQTYVGGSSALFVFHVAGNWSGTVKGLPAGMSWRETPYGIEVYSNGTVLPQGSQGIYNSSDFVASSTNKAIVKTDVEVWAETGANTGVVEDGTARITTGNAHASANVVNLINTNVVNRNFIYAVFNIAGDWQGDIDFGGMSPNLQVTTTVDQPSPLVSGSDITYNFTVRNSGDVPATGVVLSAAYNKNLIGFSRSSAISTDTTTGTSWSVGSIAPGASFTVRADAKVFAPGLTSGFSLLVPLVATASENEHDQDVSDNTQRTTITVVAPESTSEGDGGSSGDPRTSGRDRGGSGESTPPPTGGGGGGPPPPTGGGGSGPPAGGGTSAPPENGSNTNTSGDNNPSSNDNSNATNNSSASSADGGGGGGGATLAADKDPENPEYWKALPASTITLPPAITAVKSANIATTTVPTKVNYKVVVRNAKGTGPLYNGVLTDTLYDPAGKVVYTRSWPLDMVVPGDELRLSYTVSFAGNTKPGVYHNVAKVTGYEINASPIFAGRPMTPVAATGTVEILSSGQVLGEATSTVAEVTESDLQVSNERSCAPLITSNLLPGMSGPEVTKLQTFLAKDSEVYPQGLITGYFGPLTTAAVKAFQRKYVDAILAPLGLAYATGLVYSSTLKQINILACGGRAPDMPAESATPSPSAPATSRASVPKAPAASKTTSEDSGDSSGGGLFGSFVSFVSGLW